MVPLTPVSRARPANVLSVSGEGSGKGSKARSNSGAIARGTAFGETVSANEGLIEDLERYGHPLESGCPIGKWEEVCHGNLDRCLRKAN